MTEDTKKLPAGDDTAQLQSGDDLALSALSQASSNSVPAASTTGGDEVADSDRLAETLTSLQNVIERNANELERISNELKEKRELLKNVFENDTELSTAEAQVQVMSEEVKQRRSKLQTEPQVTSLKVQIGEINEQKKELEEALSNHLVNYHQITGSKSFDTSDGDQWDFDIRAKVKARKK